MLSEEAKNNLDKLISDTPKDVKIVSNKKDGLMEVVRTQKVLVTENNKRILFD